MVIVDEGRARRSVQLALVRPPAVSSRRAYSVGIVPPLGLAYVAAALVAAGHQVVAIDALGEAPLERRATAHPGLVAHGLSTAEIVARVPATVQGIGLSVMFSQQWPHVATIARALRERFPEVPIFVGGEHATAAWEHLLEACPAVTLCVLGEGERTAVEVAAWIAGERCLEHLAGVAYRVDGRPHRAAAAARVREVDGLPRPAWELFPLERYLAQGYGHGVNHGRSIPMLATRGCPYRCTFCSSPSMWTTAYAVRSVSSVVDEIADYVARYAVTNVDFEDLTAIVRRDWILAFCAELERRGLRITFQLPSGTRSEALDRDVLAALARAGCRNLTYAPESGSERTLRAIKKKARPGRVLDSMRAAKALGINVKANLMIGFPDETRADLLETLRFGLRAAWEGVDDVPLFSFSPYPGSALYDELRRDGRVPPPDDDYYASLGYMDFTETRSYSRHVGAAELNAYRVLGMATYLAVGYGRRPWRLARTVRNVLAGRSETVLEQRLVEVKQRRFAPVDEPLARPAAAPAGVSCVLPALNEEAGIEAAVERVRRVLERHAGDFEIIVVDDGSTDRTGAILDRMAAAGDRVRVVHFARNQGYGAALRAGFALATRPIVFFTDSDDQFDPCDLARLLPLLDDADVVVGRRVGRSDGALRAALSRGYNALVRAGLGVPVRDVNCAFKLLRRPALMALGLTATGYDINAEILARAARAGLRIREHPVRHGARRTGESKVGLRDVPRSFAQLVALRRAVRASTAAPHGGVG